MGNQRILSITILTMAVAAVLAASHGVDAATALPGQTMRPIFEVELDSCSYGGGAVHDLDKDGALEVAFGTYYSDERVLALRDNGSISLELPSGGGPVDNSVTLADLDGDGSAEVLWGNSATTKFHVADSDGNDLWTFTTREVLDAPEAIGDVNGDGLLDIVLASCGSESRPGLRAFTGTSGDLLWTADTGGCYQSAPLLFDQDGDGVLDVVVSTWFDEKVRGFSGRDGTLRWETPIGGWTYHAGSFGDLNGDGVPDVALGDYSGTLWAIDGTDGTVLWSRTLPGVRYVFGPTAMANLVGDEELEIVVAAERLLVYTATGELVWSADLPGFCQRGAVVVDVGRGRPDILVAVDGPRLQVYGGDDGKLIVEHKFSAADGTDMGFQPTVADLDGDGKNDVFAVYGRGRSDTPDENWGRAVSLTLGGDGPGWPTYSHDHHHSGNYHYPPGAQANEPPLPPTATPGTPAATTPPPPATTGTSATPQPPDTPGTPGTPAGPKPNAIWLPYAIRY